MLLVSEKKASTGTEVCYRQCCGSGSGSGMEKNQVPDPGSIFFSESFDEYLHSFMDPDPESF
jgi:hypothetical protein